MHISKHLTRISILLSLGIIFGLQSAHAVNVAVVDTGVVEGEFGGSLVEGGFDFVDNDDTPNDTSAGEHGTTVGKIIILNSTSGAGLIPLKINAQDPSTVTAAMSLAATLPVKVVNHSQGSEGFSSLPALAALVDSGKVLVVQAGNSGRDNPSGDALLVSSLGGKGIVVGALGTNEVIADYSNRAGSSQDHYIVANGFSGLVDYEGTSLAAPRVSAVAADLFAASPFLTPEEVVDIILTSAKDRGEDGTDDIYGRGELDRAAAFSALGETEVPTDGGGSGSGGGGGGAIALVVGGGLIAAMMNNKKDELQKTIFTDSYGRGFTFDITNRISVREHRSTVFSMFDSYRATGAEIMLSESPQTTTTASIIEIDNNKFGYASKEDKKEFASIIHRWSSDNADRSFGINAGLADEFGALSFSDSEFRATENFLSSDLFTTPVLGYSTIGSSLSLGWKDGKKTRRLGMSVVNDQEEHGLTSNSILYESSLVEEDYRIGLQLGTLMEEGSLLGGSSDGAFSVDKTETYYFGLNGSYTLSDNLRVFASYYQGFSSVDSSRDSVLSHFKGLRTEGYGIGMMATDVFSRRDSFGIAFSSPLQSTHGNARLSLPTGQDVTGAIQFTSSTLSFADSDQEKLLESYYNYRINRKSDIYAHVSYTHNPVSDLDLKRNRQILIGWRHQF